MKDDQIKQLKAHLEFLRCAIAKHGGSKGLEDSMRTLLGDMDEPIRRIARRDIEPLFQQDVKSMTLAEVVAEIDRISNISDQRYKVRDRAVENAGSFDGSAWDLPEVRRYGELCERMNELLKEEGLR
jgi:hypothetical protein